MKQPIKRLTALLLTAVWVLGAALPALAEETGTANGEIISIATTADLLALQNRCIVDTATQNLTVQLQADRMAGGVAGQNLGSIVRCRNDGDINTALTDASGSLLGVSLSGEGGASLASVSDIGGIAGRSSGILQSCENTGAVGYASVGSNVGGIVGRTSGYLDGCTNSGTVQGSQEVGGVAGQLEPVLALQYDGGRLDDLYSELDALQGEMDTLLTHTDTGGDSISAALSALTDATRTAKDSTGALADGMVSWADDGIAAVNSTASRFS